MKDSISENNRDIALTNQGTEPTRPIVERLLPQTSIRFFVFLIGVSALVMYTFRSAIVADQFWAKCASVVIATAIGCFIAYLLLFLLANLFSLATSVIFPSPSRSTSGEDSDTRADGERSPIGASGVDVQWDSSDSSGRESGEDF